MQRRFRPACQIEPIVVESPDGQRDDERRRGENRHRQPEAMREFAVSPRGQIVWRGERCGHRYLWTSFNSLSASTENSL